MVRHRRLRILESYRRTSAPLEKPTDSGADRSPAICVRGRSPAHGNLDKCGEKLYTEFPRLKAEIEAWLRGDDEEEEEAEEGEEESASAKKAVPEKRRKKLLDPGHGNATGISSNLRDSPKKNSESRSSTITMSSANNSTQQ